MQIHSNIDQQRFKSLVDSLQYELCLCALYKSTLYITKRFKNF